MDPSQRDCARCALYAQKIIPIPEGGELAWDLYFNLRSSVVQDFGLTDQVWECYGLDLTIREFLNLLDLLEAIESGIRAWHKENKPKDG
jgi:hypothetical protein